MKIQEVKDMRAVGYLLRRAANRERKQPKRKKCVVVKKLKGVAGLKNVCQTEM